MALWKSVIVIIFLYIWGCKSQDKVDQHTKIQSAFEGDDVTIDCTYQTSSTNPTLFWYQQKDNEIPKYMLNRFSNTGQNEDEFKERFQANLSKTSVPLTIKNLCVSDSAVYYCALRPSASGNYKLMFGKGTKLIVETKDRKAPQFYRFGESCLATDFTNHTDVELTNFTSVRYTGKDYENYYSIFALNVSDENCKETEGCTDGSSGQSDIEFDEKINFMSLGLFWLRILLLKTVVFNILMTFKAWMS